MKLGWGQERLQHSASGHVAKVLLLGFLGQPLSLHPIRLFLAQWWQSVSVPEGLQFYSLSVASLPAFPTALSSHKPCLPPPTHCPSNVHGGWRDFLVATCNTLLPASTWLFSAVSSRVSHPVPFKALPFPASLQLCSGFFYLWLMCLCWVCWLLSLQYYHSPRFCPELALSLLYIFVLLSPFICMYAEIIIGQAGCGNARLKGRWISGNSGPAWSLKMKENKSNGPITGKLSFTQLKQYRHKILDLNIGRLSMYNCAIW